ncbi:MAG: DUF1858 domain-containing protein [Chloroflexi bacterium]|nr:DUF1858 domain-containing protein [Chloroflexota bacterium]
MNHIITGDMDIEDVLKRYPETREVFSSFGLHCADCIAEGFDCFVSQKDIASRADYYGLFLDKLLPALNAAVDGQ